MTTAGLQIVANPGARHDPVALRVAKLRLRLDDAVGECETGTAGGQWLEPVGFFAIDKGEARAGNVQLAIGVVPSTSRVDQRHRNRCQGDFRFRKTSRDVLADYRIEIGNDEPARRVDRS